MYLDGGKRFAIGKYPKNVKLFDTTNSVATLDAVPASDVIGPYTCNNCPSTGGTQHAALVGGVAGDQASFGSTCST